MNDKILNLLDAMQTALTSQRKAISEIKTLLEKLADNYENNAKLYQAENLALETERESDLLDDHDCDTSQGQGCSVCSEHYEPAERLNANDR